MKKIYLAGPCDNEHRFIMQKVAHILMESNQLEVYCPWTYQVPNAWSYTQEDWASFVFSKDVQEIENCDIFLMISRGRKSTAGTNWEQGYAWGLHKKVVVIQINNKPASLMTYHGCDMYFNTTTENLEKTVNYVRDILQTSGVHYYKEKCAGVLT